MSSKKLVVATQIKRREQKSTQSEAVPPPEVETPGVHLDTLELAKCLLTILDFLGGHFEDSVEMLDECKPTLERIVR